MVKQIATEFEHQQGVNATEVTRDQLWHFWDPRMRETIIAHLKGVERD
jgi:formate dehydrogenase subunit delta